uniref:Peptidase C1A papain C-terminal domain-containing protein n=1 Tax=Chromera velia CCMP2878 TaxID=1169474 RepID=A0A0G4G3C8_9ALVE|mmetsp:Transcript_26418/g.51910  ORF Transcript_26418/g.51910 Transcript_26418/m.51910 type:complete len:418 (-) Transcript_26418:995-2248(-)|eukprot:Cvel_4122.t1-p1 / transcript=Cvel_4122.t1 / gene=Cvel_4122 / organism=Chromera_velia_CCMP2878 / gene_product=Cathepsin B, putative / transcript_product=Cathepsin B, putative / location=Cvel_scaffold176:42220-45255(+) / protein_length=417 / sequence_SO=supercontig / SO=protein_coding / is_pseudo=false
MLSKVFVACTAVAASNALTAEHDKCFSEQYKKHGYNLPADELAGFYKNYRRAMNKTVQEKSLLGASLDNYAMETACQDVFQESRPAILSSTVETVNSRNVGWEAERSPRFDQWSIQAAKSLMGTVVGEGAYRLPLKEEESSELLMASDLPKNFDAREKWPECPMIGHIRDQAECGSCWAFASTEALNDRMCIASKGKFTTLLSVQDTTSCCNGLSCFSFGCNGGQPSLAWRWFVEKGVVTGGDYDDAGKGETCWPYELPMCSHHSESELPPCGETRPTPSCRSSCSEEEFGSEFKADKRRATKAYSIGSVSEIKKELVNNGPVTAAFTVYEDFLTYKGGVYHHTSGGALGGHAVKIIGYGTDEKTGYDYWLIANSWNESWGAKGLFKIKIGDCGIDSQISAGRVEISETSPVEAFEL